MAGKVKSKAGRFEPIEGGCTCGSIRYRLLIEPMFVHCCHCRWCQRETGSAFALNALVEHDQIILLAGTPEAVQTPTNSGAGQNILRCPDCRVALWSHYGSAKRTGEVSPGRHAGLTGCLPAGYPHFHGIETALGCTP